MFDFCLVSVWFAFADFCCCIAIVRFGYGLTVAVLLLRVLIVWVAVRIGLCCGVCF